MGNWGLVAGWYSPARPAPSPRLGRNGGDLSDGRAGLIKRKTEKISVKAWDVRRGWEKGGKERRAANASDGRGGRSGDRASPTSLALTREMTPEKKHKKNKTIPADCVVKIKKEKEKMRATKAVNRCRSASPQSWLHYTRELWAPTHVEFGNLTGNKSDWRCSPSPPWLS